MWSHVDGEVQLLCEQVERGEELRTSGTWDRGGTEVEVLAEGPVLVLLKNEISEMSLISHEYSSAFSFKCAKSSFKE